MDDIGVVMTLIGDIITLNLVVDMYMNFSGPWHPWPYTKATVSCTEETNKKKRKHYVKLKGPVHSTGLIVMVGEPAPECFILILVTSLCERLRRGTFKGFICAW